MILKSRRLSGLLFCATEPFIHEIIIVSIMQFIQAPKPQRVRGQDARRTGAAYGGRKGTKGMNYQSKKYAEIGEKVREELFPAIANVKIAWLASDKQKKANGKVVFAECAKVAEKFDWCCPYDFTITVYEPNVMNFNADQIRILLEHELLHIGVEENRMYTVPHDAEEFISIIRKYGIDWSRTDEDFRKEVN